MHDQDTRRTNMAASFDGSGVAISVASPLSGPILPSDVELAFWRKALMGLAALAHFNCWAAARTLLDIQETIVQPIVVRERSVTQMADMATTRSPVFTSSEPARASGRSRWPRDLPDALRISTELLESYQEAIRVIWAHSRSHDIESTASFRLSRQCFALVDACLRQAQGVGAYSDVASWKPCSVVLPAYNEAENIGETMRQCVQALSQICPNFEVIVVDDGSRDATGRIASEAAARDASIVVVHNNPNRGYGGALLAGFAAARGERIFFMDSDGQFDIHEVAILLRIVESGESPVAIGYRAKRSDPFMRKLNAWGWKLAAKHVVGLKHIRDIDCAFKLFPLSALRACQLIAQGASVNVEMLLKFERMGLQITQVPVKHMPRTKGSPTGAKLHVILRAFRELFHLRHHMRRWQPPEYAVSTGTYDIAAP